jgi:hypothetical protein
MVPLTLLVFQRFMVPLTRDSWFPLPEIHGSLYWRFMVPLTLLVFQRFMVPLTRDSWFPLPEIHGSLYTTEYYTSIEQIKSGDFLCTIDFFM